MSNVRPVSTEDLRAVAHDVANVLCSTEVGGECYHGGRHTCFTRQGRKPVPLYKVEEMCERCAASWHAVMTAALLDSVVIGQQFLGHANEPLQAATGGVTVHGSTSPLRGFGSQKYNHPDIEPRANGVYSFTERRKLVEFYQTPRTERSAFQQRYGVKATQLRYWAKS